MIFIIKKNIKYLYKNIIIFFFKFIYKKPAFNKKKINNFKITKVKIDGLKYEIYKLTNGRVFTNKNDVTAYISKDNFITSGSLQFKKFDNINSFNQSIQRNQVLTEGTPNLKKKFNGNVLSLLSGGAARNNFTHWFTDVVPRLIIFNKIYNLNEIKKFYVPSVKKHYQIESLKLLGIKEKQLISSEKYKHIEADSLFFTSHPCNFKPTEVSKWSLYNLRNLFLKKNIKLEKKYKKIFLIRDQANLINKNNLKKYSSLRVLLNENEIKKFLQDKGFTIIKPENYSFKDQIKIFNNADYVVGLYGAAMMMLTFCKRGAKILEIKPTKAGKEFKKISEKLNLKHLEIKLNPIHNSSIPQNGLLICEIEKIKNYLYKLGLKDL